MMVDNIKDQNKVDSVAGIFSCLDLSTTESKEERAEKLTKIYDTFGHKKYHVMDDKWDVLTFSRPKLRGEFLP